MKKCFIGIAVCLMLLLAGCVNEPECHVQQERRLNIPRTHIGTFTDGYVTVDVKYDNIIISIESHVYDMAEMYKTIPMVESLEGCDYSLTFANSGFVFGTKETSPSMIFIIRTNGSGFVYFLDRV